MCIHFELVDVPNKAVKWKWNGKWKLWRKNITRRTKYKWLVECVGQRSRFEFLAYRFNKRETSQKFAKKKIMTACCEVCELFGLWFQGNIFESATALFYQKVTFLKIAKQFWVTHIEKKKIFEDRRFNFAKSLVALNAPWHAPSPLIERLSSERSFRRARV